MGQARKSKTEISNQNATQGKILKLKVKPRIATMKPVDPKTVTLSEEQYFEIKKVLTPVHRCLGGIIKACEAEDPQLAYPVVLLANAFEKAAAGIKVCVLLPKALENAGIPLDFGEAAPLDHKRTRAVDSSLS